MITVVELPEFIRRAKNLLSEAEREAIVNYLAAHPASGVILTSTGGIRKLRWKREGAGMAYRGNGRRNAPQLWQQCDLRIRL